MGRICAVPPSVRTASNSSPGAGTGPVLVADATPGDQAGLDADEGGLLAGRPWLDREPGHAVLQVGTVEGRHLFGHAVHHDAPPRLALRIDTVDLKGDGRTRR